MLWSFADPVSRISAEAMHDEVQRVIDVSGGLDSVVWPDLTDKVKLGHVALDLAASDANDRFERMQVDHDAVTVFKTLGEGEFGLVQLGQLHISAVRDQTVRERLMSQHKGSVSLLKKAMYVDVAVKTTKLDVSAKEIEQFESEARLLCAFTHPNIVSVLGVCFASKPAFIVLELMGGDLRSFMMDHRSELATQPSV